VVRRKPYFRALLVEVRFRPGHHASPFGLRVAQPRTAEGRSGSGVAGRSESEDGLCRSLRATRGAATHDRRAKRAFGFDFQTATTETSLRHCERKRSNPTPSFRDAASAPDLRCAIAHRGISSFRVWSFGPSRNDEDKRPPSRSALAPESLMNPAPKKTEGTGNAGRQMRPQPCVRK
jgi:hypothetical protein